MRLEQIVVLKYLGLPLRRIGQVLRRELSLKEALRSHNHVLSSKRRRLGLAIETLGEIEQSLADGEPNWGTFAAVVRDAEADKHAELRWRVAQHDGALHRG